MIGCSAKRNNQPAPGKPWQKAAKQHRIFKGKHAGEQVAPEVTDNERRLHTGKLAAAPPEGLPSLQQLVGMRPILGIENGDNLATGKLQRIIQRLGLGARTAGRHKDQLEIGRHSVAPDRGNGLVIVLLADKLDVELAAWPIEPVECCYKLRNHVLFAIERHQYRIDRQITRLERRNFRELQPLARSGGKKADKNTAEEKQRHGNMQRQHGFHRPVHNTPQKCVDRHGDDKSLRRIKHTCGGEQLRRHGVGPHHEVALMTLSQYAFQNRWCADANALAQLRRGFQMFAQPRDAPFARRDIKIGDAVAADDHHLPDMGKTDIFITGNENARRQDLFRIGKLEIIRDRLINHALRHAGLMNRLFKKAGAVEMCSTECVFNSVLRHTASLQSGRYGAAYLQIDKIRSDFHGFPARIRVTIKYIYISNLYFTRIHPTYYLVLGGYMTEIYYSKYEIQ